MFQAAFLAEDDADPIQGSGTGSIRIPISPGSGLNPSAKVGGRMGRLILGSPPRSSAGVDSPPDGFGPTHAQRWLTPPCLTGVGAGRRETGWKVRQTGVSSWPGWLAIASPARPWPARSPPSLPPPRPPPGGRGRAGTASVAASPLPQGPVSSILADCGGRRHPDRPGQVATTQDCARSTTTCAPQPLAGPHPTPSDPRSDASLAPCRCLAEWSHPSSAWSLPVACAGGPARRWGCG